MNWFKKKPKVVNQVACMCQHRDGVMILNEWGDLYHVRQTYDDYSWKIELIQKNMNGFR